jgi:hypothetical protein
MIPRVSPSAPIRRTSFALISSLSRFSLSFALIVQHLQAKKKYRTKTQSPHGYPPLPYIKVDKKNINPSRNRRIGESGVLCFVLPAYYTPFSPVCQELFENFILFFCGGNQKITPKHLKTLKKH